MSDFDDALEEVRPELMKIAQDAAMLNLGSNSGDVFHDLAEGIKRMHRTHVEVTMGFHGVEDFDYNEWLEEIKNMEPIEKESIYKATIETVKEEDRYIFSPQFELVAKNNAAEFESCNLKIICQDNNEDDIRFCEEMAADFEKDGLQGLVKHAAGFNTLTDFLAMFGVMEKQEWRR